MSVETTPTGVPQCKGSKTRLSVRPRSGRLWDTWPPPTIPPATVRLWFHRLGSVSKVEMVTPTAWSYKELFPSISTFETPPQAVGMSRRLEVHDLALLFARSSTAGKPRTGILASVPTAPPLA